jgi:hypothetical protein
VDEDASNITGREAVMLINTLLIIAGFLDIVFGLPSVIICLRELCDCYNPTLLTGTVDTLNLIGETVQNRPNTSLRMVLT